METTSKRAKPYTTTAVYYLGFICLGMATAVLGPTLQGLAANTGSSLARISSLFLVISFGYLLGSYTSGKLYDRVKGHPILCFALLFLAALMAAVPLVKAIFVLQLLFFIIGNAEGILDVGLNTLIVWLHGNRVPPFMNGLHAFYGIGTTTAPLIVAAVLSSEGSLNNIYWSLALLTIPVGLLILFFPSPSHIRARQQAENQPATPVLIFLIAVIFFAFTGAELGFAGWIYTYTTFQGYANPMMAASINAAFWAALTAGRLISIPISVKLSSKSILWINFCGTVISLLVIIFFSSSQTLLWLGTICTGFFMGPIFPTLLNDAQGRMHMSGKITSRFIVAGSLGSMVLPWLMGQLIVPFGITSAVIAVLCSILFASVTFYILNIKQPAITSPSQFDEMS